MASKKELLDEFESMSDEQLARLSLEELDEIESLLQAPDTPEPAPEQGGEGEEIKATLAGAAQGATFGFADEISALGETAYDVLKATGEEAIYKGVSGVEMNLAEIREQYDSNLKSTREEFDRLEAKHGNYYTGGDISGSILSGLATGGSGALFGLGAKAAIRTAGIAAVQGAAHGVGRGEARTIDGILEEAGMGSVYDVGGTLVGGAVGKGIGKVATKMGAETYLNFLGARMGQARKGIMTKLTKFNRPVADYAERMTDYKTIDGEYLIKGSRSPEELLHLTDLELSHQGDQMAKYLKEINHTPDPVKVAKEVSDFLTKKIQIAKEAKNPDLIEKYISLQDSITNRFVQRVPKGKDVIEEVHIPRTLYELQQLKNTIGDELADATSSSQRQALTQFRNKLGKVIHESAEEAGDATQYAAFKNANDLYGDLKNTKEVLKKINETPEESPLSRLFGYFITRNSVLATGIGAASGALSKGAVMGAIALEKIASSRRVAAPVARTLNRVSKVFRNNPDRWEAASQSLVAASAVSSEAFDEVLESIDAQVSLSENPLPRTSEDVIKRKGTVLTIVEQISEDTAAELRDAINHRDISQIQKLMGSIAHLDRDKLLQPGIGWDGMAVTEQDVNQVNTWISKIRNVRKRKNLSIAFNNGSSPSHMVIPQELRDGIDPDEEPSKVWEFVKRNKDRPEF